jgi:hypothetical protein
MSKEFSAAIVVVSAYRRGTIATPFGATNVKVLSGSPLFTAIFVNFMVTVLSN